LVGLALVLLASRHPGRAIAAVVLILPWNQFILAWLYGNGLSAGLVRTLGFWQVALVFSVVLAGFRRYRQERHRLDRLDVVALAYLALGTVYYVLPHLFVRPDFPVPTAYVRELGLRQDGLFVLLFIGARHCRLTRRWAEQITPLVLLTGALVALIGLYEFSFTHSWNHIAIDTFHIVKYKVQVTKVSVPSTTDIESHASAGGRRVVRIGSVLLSPLTLGSWLLIPLALGVERIARGAARVGTVVAVGLVGSALILTETRSAILGGVVIIALVARPAVGRQLAGRVRFVLVAGALVVLAIPLVLSSGLGSRTTSAAAGTDTSANGHVHAFAVGFDAMVSVPLGHGIGTGPGIGDRFNVFGQLTPENYYLQIGDEMGLFGCLLFILFTILALRRLAGAQRDGPGGTFLSGAWTAGVALAIGCLLLHVWAEYPDALTYWSLAGAALGIGEVLPRPDRRTRPALGPAAVDVATADALSG
jgi:hypothetical protein